MLARLNRWSSRLGAAAHQRGAQSRGWCEGNQSLLRVRRDWPSDGGQGAALVGVRGRDR